MVRFTITFFVMVILFLGGVIVGFDQAGTGMNNLSGNDVNEYDAVEASKQGDDYQVDLLGESFEQKPIEEKKEEYQDINQGLFTEKLAATVEGGVKWFFNMLIEGAYQISELFYRV
ncbi:hypothetical protein [Salinibacillus xinjiangensis]|uniref:DUF3679 domain-containing protein n=1 Tax=Salinibacillus xinjiangensis TaxID=1229268 RepID=A0A6G1X6T8_9BACI|nr:hypothetical protein [Salinibacillus xinjiangensis]MRG86652.1 hypothetical protein [Salinibacillus xinjiangensis]